jgi:hypothetical protein
MTTGNDDGTLLPSPPHIMDHINNTTTNVNNTCTSGDEFGNFFCLLH